LFPTPRHSASDRSIRPDSAGSATTATTAAVVATSVTGSVPALAVTGGLWVGAYALAGTLPVTLVATTAAVVAVVALPALSGRIERSLAE
ncbi:hypothetical protein DJ79_00920, partial [Halorubrum ezzemoulense]